MSGIDEAFRATTYRVFVPGQAPMDLVVGRRSARLDALLARGGVTAWAFITASNPGSQPLAAHENSARHAELLMLLHARGLQWLAASGIPADAGWEAEESVLVLGVSRPDAVEIGRRFGQLAIVAGQRGAAAELVYCA